MMNADNAAVSACSPDLDSRFQFLEDERLALMVAELFRAGR